MADTAHLLDDVALCGPGELAMQWHCECGAWGKPVPLRRDGLHHHTAGTKVLAGHRRHAARAASQPPADPRSDGSGGYVTNDQGESQP